MQAKDLVFNQSGERKVVKEIGKVFPDIGVAVLSQAFVVKAVHLCDLAGFVIATEDGYAGRIAYLERDEEGDGLDGKVATIDIVTHEQIIGVWIGTANLEELHQVMKLAVNISADRHWAFHWLHIGLFRQNLACLVA